MTISFSDPHRTLFFIDMKPKQVNELQKQKPSVADVIINTLYMTILSSELMLRDVESRLRQENAQVQREKKQNLTRFFESTKRALYYAEQLTQDIYDVDADKKWKNIPVWQEESNELARLILLYADKSADVDNVFKVFKTLREIKGEGIIDDSVLENYYLKKFD